MVGVVRGETRRPHEQPKVLAEDRDGGKARGPESGADQRIVQKVRNGEDRAEDLCPDGHVKHERHRDRKVAG